MENSHIQLGIVIILIILIILGIKSYTNTTYYKHIHTPVIARTKYYKNASQKQIQDTNVHKALLTHTIYSPSFKHLMYNNIANFHSPYLSTNDENDNTSYQGLLFNHHIIQNESLTSTNSSIGNSKSKSTYQNLTYTEVKNGVIDSPEFVTNYSTFKTLTITPTATKSPFHKITYKLINVKYNHHNHKNYIKLVLKPIKIVKNKDTHMKLNHIHKDLILTENRKLKN